MLDCARCATAAQVERLARAWLAPEVGAVVRQALEAAADRLRAEVSPDEAAETSAAQRRADALGLVAESALAGGLDRGTAGDRYRVVLHVEADALRAAAPASDAASDAGRPADVGHERGASDPAAQADGQRAPAPPAGQAALEDADGLRVSAETSRRLACDAAVVVMRHGAGGEVLDVGRRTRTVPPALRRALEARDRHCRFPGCQARRCDSHHVEHWADGGATKLSNLVRLCRRHHRAVHEEGFTVRLDAGGAAEFRWPDGRPLPAAPAVPGWTGLPLAPTAERLRSAGIRLGPDTATPVGGGGRLDTALRARRAVGAAHRGRIGVGPTAGVRRPGACGVGPRRALLSLPAGRKLAGLPRPR